RAPVPVSSERAVVDVLSPEPGQLILEQQTPAGGRDVWPICSASCGAGGCWRSPAAAVTGPRWPPPPPSTSSPWTRRPRMLAAARARALPPQRVTFRLGTAYAPDEVAGEVDAELAMQWVSPVPRRRLGAFLDAWHARVAGSGTAAPAARR